MTWLWLGFFFFLLLGHGCVARAGMVWASFFFLFFLNGTEFDTVSKSCITEFGFQIWV